MENKMQATMWKSMKNCIRSSQKWVYILFETIHRKNKQCKLDRALNDGQVKLAEDLYNSAEVETR